MNAKRRAYVSYLKSPAWKSKRAKVKLRDGGRCRLCGNGGLGLEVHHLTYERFGAEHLSDLILLCHGCHAEIHAQDKTLQRENTL